MIYADYNGSAPLLPSIREYLATRLMEGPYANPNAIHSLGKKMLFGLEKCRRTCAKHLGANSEQIIFNSGSSEGISHVFHSVLNHQAKDKSIIITSEIEHSAVVKACTYYEEYADKTILKVKTLPNGQIDLEHFKELLTNNATQTALVCIMAANNETGVIQPWQQISSLCNEQNVLFFSDTTQYIGKTDFNFQQSGMDFAVLSGHKIGAIIGSGILLVKNPTDCIPMVFGGGQEFGLRNGTQNYIGAETLALALEQFSHTIGRFEELAQARDQFEKNICQSFPEVKIMGQDAPRLATTTMLSYPGVHGQAVQIELESQEIYVTTSSACSDNQPDTSKVLRAMGITDPVGRGVVRIGLCAGSPAEYYAQIESALKMAYTKLSNIKSF